MCDAAPHAFACGGGGVANRTGVVMGSQRIIMSVRAGGTTDMIAQVTVPQTTADYGVLIPVPSEPTLDNRPVSSADLNELDRMTAPVIESSSEGSSGARCGCGSVTSSGTPRGGGVLSHDSKAFVLEGATSRSSVANYAPGIAQFMDEGAVITRATTVVGRAQLSDDVVFATPFSGSIPSRRQVSLSPVQERYASIGALGLLFVAHALRRRGRQC